jgi:sugar lactone lactonase YvrE
LGEVTISNGLAWTGDGLQAYNVDTPTGRVDVFDVDTSGELVDRRPFVSIEPSYGSPDGLTVDSAGGVWVALWNGHAVR